MAATRAIIGIPLPQGAPLPTRKEISAWIALADNDPLYARQVALFIKALAQFQKIDPNDELSYYRVAGIHGEPDVSWDGAKHPAENEQDPPLGWWCVHNKANFVSWHRPYLALFEQTLYQIMVQLISESGLSADDQQQWTSVAQQWRLPYWDWAIKQKYLGNYGIPQIFTQQTVTILDFNNARIQVSNPLWTFDNPLGIPMGSSSMGKVAIDGVPWASLVGTSRCAILSQDPDPSWINGANNWQAANNFLQTADWSPGPDAGPLGEAVYKLLTPGYSSSWETFETTLYTNPDPANFLSIEYIHNYIHGWTGGTSFDTGTGHMSDPAVSAFDPIFWFHHANCDRIAAIFQTLNPDVWYQVASRGTRSLTPFHKDTHGTFWTADACRNWKTFNYDYDDLSPPADPSSSLSTFGLSLAAAPPIAATSEAPAVIKAAPITAAAASEAPGTDVSAGVDITALKRQINARYGRIRNALRESPEIDGRKNDYIINVIYDRYALGGCPYIVHFFVGAAPSGPISAAVIQSSNSYLGSVYTFSSGQEGQGTSVACHNCRRQKNTGVLSTGQLPISVPLLTHAKDQNIPELQSLHPDAVEVYLETKLTWIAVEVNGSGGSESILDIPSQLPRTRIYALKGIAEHPESENELSAFTNYEFLWGATRGKPGGADQGDVPPEPIVAEDD